MSAITPHAGSPTDFDFLVGEWVVHHLRLRTRHVGSRDWDEFVGTSRCWTLLDGVANVDEMDCSSRGFSGMSMRTLDLVSRRWSIYWISSGDGRLLPPVQGCFGAVDAGSDDDRGAGRGETVGEFVGHDVDGDLPVMARFIWTVRTDAPRWEQAFSADGGTTWETNWVMKFRRV